MSWTDPFKTSSLVVMLLSLVSTISSTVLLVWFTVGMRGIFWGSLGDKQYVYFSIVMFAIFVVSCSVWLCRLNTVALILTAALGGYLGSLIAYCYFDFATIEKMIARGDYYILIRPFVLPTHIIFVFAGGLSVLLMISFVKAYDMMTGTGGRC